MGGNANPSVNNGEIVPIHRTEPQQDGGKVHCMCEWAAKTGQTGLGTFFCQLCILGMATAFDIQRNEFNHARVLVIGSATAVNIWGLGSVCLYREASKSF